MKVFYSELVANPSYYSFGYSIYGLLEEGDSLSSVYSQGFLPFVGAREQPSQTFYQARGVRVLAQEFQEAHYHRYALKKAEPHTIGVIVTVYARANYPDPEALVRFFADYFRFRFGKGSVPKERLIALLASPLLTHVVEYRLRENIVGIVLETRGEDFRHVWYYAYPKALEKHCMGLYLCIDFVKRASAAGKRYAYFGATYGLWMKYKTHFEPLEYWNGAEWRRDPKGKELKQLMKGDLLRQVAFVDAWREERKSFLSSPYPFTSIRSELRFLALVSHATPRVMFVCVVGIALLCLFIGLTTLR
ncbi:MAG TPA: hypothetical protein VF696_00610 [Candidatus Paceibacterota bacterium]|jgi:arginyl-tRNA--protein-N-Asp/Glu arginylyltransferase